VARPRGTRIRTGRRYRVFDGRASAEWIINRGAADGMEVGLPVVGQNGLAGVIREVSDRTSRVQALSDPQSAVGVAERDARNRGIVFGVGRDLPWSSFPKTRTHRSSPERN
jgi:cell shape-determining protein MreC